MPPTKDLHTPLLIHIIQPLPYAKYMTFFVSACTVIARAMAPGVLSSEQPLWWDPSPESCSFSTKWYLRDKSNKWILHSIPFHPVNPNSPRPERHKMRVISWRWNWHGTGASDISVAQLIRQTLQFVRVEVVVVPQHVVMRWSARALAMVIKNRES